MKHVIDALNLKVEVDFCEDDLNNGSYYRDEKIPERCAVYVLWRGDFVAYVGMTKNLNRRIHEHAADK